MRNKCNIFIKWTWKTYVDEDIIIALGIDNRVSASTEPRLGFFCNFYLLQGQIRLEERVLNRRYGNDKNKSKSGR